MDFWQGLGALLFAQATLAAGMIYVAKALFGQVLTRDLENHKYQLSRELEQFKRNLDAIQFERQTKFSLMHEKRAEVIATLYGKLAAAHSTVAHMTRLAKTVSADEGERRKEATDERKVAADALNGLKEYFITHRIFLSEASGKKTEHLIGELTSSFIEFDLSQGHFSQGRVDHKTWVEVWKRVTKELPVLLDELREEFQKALEVQVS